MGKSRYSEAQILRILRDAKAGATVTDVCRRHGISPRTFRRWKAKYGGIGGVEAGPPHEPRSPRDREDPHRLLLLQLETLRALLSRTAPDVSLSFYFWSRAPGNDYVSFYPTAWLPSLDAWRRGHVGDESIFRRVMERGSGQRALTFATSERGTWTMAWKVLSEGEQPFDLDLARGRDPQRAAAALADALDVRWLAAHGNVDPATSAVVDRWLGDALDVAARIEATWVTMAYEQTAAIADLWRLRLHSRHETLHVPWPDRAAALVESSRSD